MSSITYNVWRPQNIVLVIGVTVLINLLLFAGLPLLTRVADRDRTKKPVALTLLTQRRQVKPPEAERERRLRREELRLAPKPKTQTRTTRRQTNIPKFGFEFSDSGFGNSVFVDFDTEGFGIDMADFGFRLDQVDKAPRPIRKVNPVYPFGAKRKGIKARVKVRGLVDVNGDPQKVVAAECDPADSMDVFGPAAVAAFKKWRFAPGEIGGDPVPTRVAINIYFEIE